MVDERENEPMLGSPPLFSEEQPNLNTNLQDAEKQPKNFTFKRQKSGKFIFKKQALEQN